MKKRIEYHRLPNGEYTTSLIQKSRAWHKIGNKLKKEFGFIMDGYDPTISCHLKGYTDSLQISVNMANILLNRVGKLKKQIKELKAN